MSCSKATLGQCLYALSLAVALTAEAVGAPRAALQLVPGVQAFSNSIQRQETRFDLARPLGRSAALGVYLPFRAQLFQNMLRAEAVANAGSSKVRGDAAEGLMDDFFTGSGGGWQKIQGQYGSQGIDGLYVKRMPSGVIYEFQIVDSKANTSSLSPTRHGWQLSQEWNSYKLKVLLQRAKEAYVNNPTRENFQAIQDYEQIIRLMEHGVTPSTRVYHTELATIDGKTVLIQRNGIAVQGPGGKIMVNYDNSKPMIVDMKSPVETLGKRQRAARENFYAQTEDALVKSGLSRRRASRIVNELNGRMGKTIKNSQDYHAALRKELAARARFQNRMMRTGGILFGGLMEAGFVLARDGVVRGVDGGSYSEAAGAFLRGSATYAAVDTGVAFGAHKATKYVATRMAERAVANRFAEKAAANALQNMSREAISRQMQKTSNRLARSLAKKLAPKLAGAAAGSVQGLVSAYEITITCADYNAGKITQRDAIVYSSLGTVAVLGSAAMIFLTCTKTGAALGSWAGPAGVAIGAVTGALAGVGGFAYGVYTGFEEEKMREIEMHTQAEWATRRRSKNLDKEIEKCQMKSEAAAVEAWALLLSDNSRGSGKE